MISRLLPAWLRSRGWPAACVGAIFLFLMTASADVAVAGPAPCNTTTTSTDSVQLCLTQPDAGSTVSGNVSVLATATMIVSGNIRVVRMVFTVDDPLTGYTLTDYQSPYTFALPTTKWVDGVHPLSV